MERGHGRTSSSTRLLRVRHLLVALLAAGVAAGAVAVPGPAAAADPPVAAFDYSMPKRFGEDRNGDGKIDYFTGTSDDPVVVDGHEKQVDPDTWTVHLDACASTPGSDLVWSVIDHPDPSAPLAVSQVGSGCADHRLTVPEEGTYRVALVAVKDGLPSAPVVREVVVQDWLIVSVGDSYGSGEGVPDIPIDQAALVNAEAKWDEAADAWAAVAQLRLDYAGLDTAIASWRSHTTEAAYRCDPTHPQADAGRCTQLAGLIAYDAGWIVAEAVELGLVAVGATVENVINAIAASIDAAIAKAQAAVQVAFSVTGQLTGEWQHKRCHRSANAGSARAAKQLEDVDPRTSVTFLHLACSGASVIYGLLGLYEGAESAGVANKDCDDQPGACIPAQLDVAKDLVGDREVDAVYVSIGGNDAHFADLIIACVTQNNCQDPDNWVADTRGNIVSLFCDPLAVLQFGFVLQAKCGQFAQFIPDFAKSAAELWEEGKNGEPDPDPDSMFLGHAELYRRLNAALVQQQGDPDGWLVPAGRSDRVFISEYVDAVKHDTGRYCDWATDGLKTLPMMSNTEAAWVDTVVSPELSANVQANEVNHGWKFVGGIFSGFTNRGYCADDHYLVRVDEAFLNQGSFHGMVHPNTKGHGVYGNQIFSAWKSQLYTGAGYDQPRRPDQAPFADAGGPYTLDEGSATPLTNSSWDGEGEPLTFAWSQDRPGRAALSSATAPAPDLTGLDDTTGTVAVSVSDADGSRSDTAPFQVRNVAPTVDAGADSTATEGVAHAGSTSYSDPGTLDTHAAAVAFGDGASTGPSPATAGSAPWSHTWRDEGTMTVTTTVTDDDGGSGSDARVVTVENAPPVLSPVTAPVDPVLLGTAITTSATFTDLGVDDVHTAVWDWGDGSTSPGVVTEAGGAGSVAGAHTYPATGIYTVTLTVDDGDPGGRATQRFEYVVVYDPAGGFTTGGGWIESPPGAHTPQDATDADVTGNAIFAFVSKYQKGASVPAGTTSFRFKAADLTFASTAYDWLVISGSRAQYKGSGTVDGQGGYRFLLAAVDGDAGTPVGPDRFRIKIWESSSGRVVYDNQAGDADDALASTAIGGGQIKVHPPGRS